MGWFLKSQIPIVSGILDSLSWIMDSKDKDSGLHKPKFPAFWIPWLLLLLEYYIFSDINNTIYV